MFPLGPQNNILKVLRNSDRDKLSNLHKSKMTSTIPECIHLVPLSTILKAIKCFKTLETV